MTGSSSFLHIQAIFGHWKAALLAMEDSSKDWFSLPAHALHVSSLLLGAFVPHNACVALSLAASLIPFLSSVATDAKNKTNKKKTTPHENPGQTLRGLQVQIKVGSYDLIRITALLSQKKLQRSFNLPLCNLFISFSINYWMKQERYPLVNVCLCVPWGTKRYQCLSRLQGKEVFQKGNLANYNMEIQ